MAKTYIYIYIKSLLGLNSKCVHTETGLTALKDAVNTFATHDVSSSESERYGY